ncbi:MAG: peptidase M23 [Flavobacteriales bacterium]|nr:MAG: peptidase M23 [Flavobacteriales bacterium]
MVKKNYILLLLSILLLSACNKKVKKEEEPEVPEPVYAFGYNMDDYIVKNDTVKSGDTFGVIMDRHHLTVNEVYNIIESTKDTFDYRQLRLGKPYTVFCSKDSLEKAQVFVYQPSVRSYSIIDFKDSLTVARTIVKPLDTIRKTATGIITSSLFETLEEQKIDPYLAVKLSQVYEWSIDFYRIQKYDKFKVIYDEYFVDDTVSVGIGNIQASYFEHWGNPHYAFGYEIDSIHGNWQFYDEKAKEMKRMFLKSPIEFGRISSRYSMSRYVSIYGRRRPHLGTDFAAPVGTPIRSTANGVVTASAYRGGNGNYVKIKHNKTYSTQYLHMSKRAVKKGQYVKQGDIIGYIGMTGNTTGPHVCYRFWKNGRQVDALKHTPKDSEPMPEALKAGYLKYIEPVKMELDALSYPEIKEPEIEVTDPITS